MFRVTISYINPEDFEYEGVRNASALNDEVTKRIVDFLLDRASLALT